MAESDRQAEEVAEAFRRLGDDEPALPAVGGGQGEAAEQAAEALHLRALVLSPEQRRTRALLGCVIPFDLLTQRISARGMARGSEAAAAAFAPASAAGALEALNACKRALREELAINAWAAGLEITIQGRLKRCARARLGWAAKLLMCSRDAVFSCRLASADGWRASLPLCSRSLWSTHCKMQRKNAPAMEIFDARALRVVVSGDGGGDDAAEVTACYRMLGAVHRLWRPVRGEYDDYIANPKASGYRSLHTAVLAADGLPLEVQIRTRAMHEDAEYGTAAHWLYKDAAPPRAGPTMMAAPASAQGGGPLVGPPPPVEQAPAAAAGSDGMSPAELRRARVLSAMCAA